MKYNIEGVYRDLLVSGYNICIVDGIVCYYFIGTLEWHGPVDPRGQCGSLYARYCIRHRKDLTKQ